MNPNFEALKILVEETLEQEYKDFYGGYRFVIGHLATGCTSVRYVEVQSKIVDLVKNNRQTARQLDEYFDSDYGLANQLLHCIVDSVGA